MRLLSLKLFTLLVFCNHILAFAQFIVPQKPTKIYPIYDEVGLLTEQEKNIINDKLIKFYDSTSVEILVAIIPTTNGEDVNFAATMLGEKWGIGEKEQDNGFVFLIAKDDRKFAIQQGRGAEKYVTASVLGQINDYIITPNFKQGLWFEGVNRGTTALMEAVQGKFHPVQSEDIGDDVSVLKLVLIIFFILIILSFLFGNKGGGGHYDDDDDVILSRRGRRTYPGGFFPFPSGGFGGGSSGGGFGGFGGGGSFGGGGASGSW